MLHPKKASTVASDLLALLKQSAKAIELMDTAIFHFVLDPQFKLTITSEPTETTSEESEESV